MDAIAFVYLIRQVNLLFLRIPHFIMYSRVLRSLLPMPCTAHSNTTSTQLEPKAIFDTTQRRSIGHPVARGEGSLHSGQQAVRFFMQERCQPLARLNLTMLITRTNAAQSSRARHHCHSSHLQLLIPRGQWEHLHVLRTLLLDGALVLCAGFNMPPFGTWTANVRESTLWLARSFIFCCI
jgi:hypothetical protein